LELAPYGLPVERPRNKSQAVGVFELGLDLGASRRRSTGELARISEPG